MPLTRSRFARSAPDAHATWSSHRITGSRTSDTTCIGRSCGREHVPATYQPAPVISFLACAILALAPCAVAQTWKADNGNGTYTNPLFFDEFSDPDMIRVGTDFYLTGTTMHSMPGLPVLHSRDLVNWTFVSYALDRLDLGPSFRLEDGKNEYGRGIWAPCFRFHDGTFYIFSNVNGQTTQLFRATNPAGPWTRTPMKRSLHDLSVLFDDDGKVYVVWGYRGIRIAQLTEDLTDIVPGTERELIAPAAGMGEGLHFYKIDGKYFITSAWFMDEMRMPVARADRLEGPWEVNQNVSRGEDFGLGVGYRVGRSREAPFQINPPDASTARPLRHPPGRHRRHADGRVVGLLDDGRQRGRPPDGAVAGHVDGRLAVLRPARQPRTHAAHVGEAEHRRGGAASCAVPAQRRLLRRSPAAGLAMEPRAGRRQVVAPRAARASFGCTRCRPPTSGTRETRSRSAPSGRARR